MNAQVDPFSKWKTARQPSNIQNLPDELTKENPDPPYKQQQSTLENQNQQDPFSKWKNQQSQNPRQLEFPFEGENDLEREIERNIAQQSSRIGETVLGLPGDIEHFGRWLFGFNQDTALPTSKSLREKSESATLGYSKPKNEFEGRAGEFLQDVASFAIPGSKQYGYIRNIGIPVAGQLAKEGVKKIKGDSATAEYAKLGTMLMLDLVSQRKGGPSAYAGELFGESESLIPKGATISASNLSKSLTNARSTLAKGGSAPSKSQALTKIDEVLSKIHDGNIPVDELVQFRKDINEVVSQLGGYNVDLPKPIKRKAISNLQNVKKSVIESLDEYGKVNPEFGKLNKSANEAYAVYETSNKIAKKIGSAVESMKLPLIKKLFGLGALGGVAIYPAAAVKIAAPLAAAKVGYEGYKILHQVILSPTLRAYYGNILKGAASGNTSQISRNAQKLEKGLEKMSED